MILGAMGMPDGNQQGAIKKTGLGKQAAPQNFDYNPIVSEKVIKKRLHAPRDIPNSGINERERFLRKHPGGLKIEKHIKSTDIEGSKKKFNENYQNELKSLGSFGAADEGKIKSEAAKRRQKAMGDYQNSVSEIEKTKEPGARQIKEGYAQRGLANSGMFQGALQNYEKQFQGKFKGVAASRDAALKAIMTGEQAGLGKIGKSRAAARQGVSAKYKAALKRLGS